MSGDLYDSYDSYVNQLTVSGAPLTSWQIALLGKTKRILRCEHEAFVRSVRERIIPFVNHHEVAPHLQVNGKALDVVILGMAADAIDGTKDWLERIQSALL